MSQKSTSDYAYDRPVFIVAAPRSGSTLLFETLSRSQILWTNGDESHMVFENIQKLSPQRGGCSSNRLVAGNADEATIDQIRGTFLEKMRNAKGQLFRDVRTAVAGKPRFLEKTPKNSLRVSFLNKVFPDALFIYLFRDPRENLSSMIEAWRSSDFVTYSGLPEWPGQWSLLLPPDYVRLRGTSLEEIVAFQWQAANKFVLEDIADLPDDRWTAVSYAELVANTPAVIEQLCQFADIPFDESLQAYCEKTLPLSRYTKSAPKTGKWRMNEAMIERVMDGLRPLIEQMEAAVASHSSSPVLHSGPIQTSKSAGGAFSTGAYNRLGRNERCPCGSGLRYKHCHGKMRKAHNSMIGTDG